MKRIISFISLLLLCGCTLITEPENPTRYNAKIILDDTINLINTTYPYLSFKGIDTDSLHAVYASKLDQYRGDRVHNLLLDLLSELRDGHVSFYNPAGYSVGTYKARRSIKDRYAFSLNLVRSYASNDFQTLEDHKITYGKLTDQTGYIHVATMAREGFNFSKFTVALRNLGDTEGLILDVRSNGGGSDRVTYYLVSHFIKEPFPSPIWLDHEGNEMQRTYLTPHTYHYLKPVILLQNGTCYSATEGFISMMQELEMVTTIGDTTGGGTGAPGDFLISYDFKIHLSRFAQLTYQGDHIEWNGITPDILVPQTKLDIENQRDLQLETALRILQE